MKKIFTLITTILFVGSMWATDPVSVTINFGTDETDWAAHTNGSYTDSDSRVWTRTFSAGNKSSGQATYSQFGNSNNACTSLVFYATAGSNISVSAFSVKMAGASGSTSPTTGTIYLYKRPAVGADVQLATASVDGTTTVECKITSAESFTSTDKLVVDYVGTAKAIRISELKYTYSAAPKNPGVSVDPAPVAFGDVKQHSKGALDTEYVFKNFTVTGENLTGNITVNAPEGSIFELWNPETGSVIGTSIDLTPDANKAVEKELAIMAATGWSGAQNGSFTITGGGLAENVTVNITMNVTPTFEVAVAVNDGEMGTATINGQSALYTDGNDVLNLVATPKAGYEFVNWTVSDGDVLEVETATSTTTTATAIDAGTITANFVAQSCTNLTAPTLGSLSKTYNYANITWTAVEHADHYVFNLREHEGDARTPLNTSSLGTEMLNLKANTQYDYTVMAVGDGEAYCDDNNPLLEGSFTTEDYPAATLTLSENGETRTWGEGLKITSEIALPTAVADGNEVAGKVLVGWSENAECAAAPELAKGANYTMEATAVTLYAVYAKETPGAKTTTTDELTTSFFGSPSSYTNWSGKVGTSGAVYAGNTTTNNSSNIQMRSSDNSGIVTTGTAGKVTKVTVTWNSGTTNGRTLNVYGSTTAYTAPSNLYVDTLQVTLLGTIVYGTSTVLNITGSYDYLGLRSNSGAMYISKIELEWTLQAPSTYSNYTTTGVKAPQTTVNPTSVNLEETALVGGLIDVAYSNVDEENVSVALFNDAECTEAFDGGWLTASLDANKDIVYGAEAAVSYANARTAYIKLTAPSTDANVDPAIVVIPVEQAKKAAVFASLAELVAATEVAEDSVTVSFSNIEITGFYKNSKNEYYGVYLNVNGANDKNIEIYFNKTEVPEPWISGGKLSGTIRAKWTHYTQNSNDVWELCPPNSTWAWTNLTYTKPLAPISWTNATASAYTVGKENSFQSVVTEDEDDANTFVYSSSNTDVAQIDASTGAISNLAAGQTTISATLEENTYYQETTISYTLTVYAPASVVVTGDATKKAYEKGETFSFAGLGAKAVYGDEAEYTIPAEQITWAPAPAPAINANGNVEVTATWQELTSAAEVVAVTVNTHAVTLAAVENGSVVLTIKGEVEPLVLPANLAKGTIVAVAATPAKGYVLSTLTAGSADIKESKSFTIGTEDVEVAAAFARPYVAIMGQFNEWSGAANPLAVALDEKTASAAITLTLNENYGYGFKVLCGDNTLSIENGSEWYHLKRTWTSAAVKYISATSNPIWIEMDMSGDYTFTWDYTDSTLTITYPALPEWEYYVAGSFTDWSTKKVKMTTTDEETWTATFELEANKTGENKYEFKIVEKQLGETWLGLQSAASMVYGNCTDWVIGGGEAAIGLETTKKANYTFTYVPATKKVSVDIPNPSPATGVDNTADETKAVKFLENGQIFILRGDKTYTIDGQLVK